MEFNEFIEIKHKESELNFKGVLDILEETGVTFKVNDLYKSLGIATMYGLYIDIDKMNSNYVPDKLILFVILHEIAHYKRMMKFGKEHYLEKLSRPDFENFFEGVIEEEVFADRWASLMYYKLNGEVYPKWMTQQLDLKEQQAEYKPSCTRLFGVVDNDEENYKELIKRFVL